MRTINANSKYITLGRQGENKVTEVIFDLTDWIEEIGNGGSFSLWHRPSGSNIKYPANISVVGGVISWLVTRTDTYISGRGQAEIIYVLNDKIAKTAIYETQVYPSLESITNGELTPDEEDYITRVIEYIEAHSDEASISEAVEKYMEEHPIDVVAEDEVKAIINSYKFYAKPNAGIPYVDLDIGVRRSLTRADNAILAETDPTVPSWAKQPTKPTYSYNELTDLPELPSGGGAINDTDVHMTEPFSGVTLNEAFTQAYGIVEEVALEAESKVSDVQINGVSITEDGVANIQKASSSTLGVVATDTWNGTTIDAAGHIGLFASQETHLNNRTSNTAITPKNLDLALKIALTDGKSSWTDAEKASARNLLGVTGTTGSTIDDVQVVGVSVVQNGIATIPAASTTEYGTVKLGGTNNGIGLGSIGQLYVARASDSEITAKSNGYKPIVPSNLDYAVKSGLADSKAAWTDAEKTAARGLLGIGGDGSSVSDIQVNGVSVLSNGVANIPTASTAQLGAVKAGTGVSVTDDGGLFIQSNWDSQLSDRANRTNQAVTLGFIDKSVTAVLTDGKAPALTEKQKKAAQDWLGISGLIGGVEELIAEISEVVG